MSDLKISAASLSDRGLVRQTNQDACFADARQNIFIVSDGMGGGPAGEKASGIVIAVLPDILVRHSSELTGMRSRSVREFLRDSILRLSRQMREKTADDPALHGMGATIVLVFIRKGSAHVAHMGDSRAYLFRNGALRCLTEDHSVVRLLVQEGQITPQEARRHPARGKVTRFVGMATEVFPATGTVRIRRGDQLLLCSDGLWGMVNDDAIAGIMSKQRTAEAACRALTDAAKDAGGLDNIGVVVVRVA